MSRRVIAVIGLGSIAKRHRGNLKVLFPDAKIVALSASGRAPVETVNDADEIVASLGELIDCKPMFVIVASPATFHLRHAKKLIESNIPTLIEKPLSASCDDAQKIRYLGDKHKTPVAVGYCLRYLSSAIKMKELISEQCIGSIYNCAINIGQYLPEWRPDSDYRDSVSASKALGGGVLLELSHELDYAQWLLGPLTLESAILRNSSELDLDVEEIADVILSSEKGTICNIHLDFLQKSPQRSCSFIGSKGRLDWNLMANTITHINSERELVIFTDPEWDKNNMYLNMVRDFINLIEGKPNSSICLPQAELSIHLIAAIKSKAIWGKVQ